MSQSGKTLLFYQNLKEEIENRLDIEEISTKKSFPFFLIRQEAAKKIEQ